jgi:hypothetical protein
VSNSCGILHVTSCFHELCTNSAIGSIVAQVRGRLLVQGRRYCSTQAFIHSVWPSVRGWNALERFCCIPKFLHIARENCDANRGSRSEMMRRGSPKKGRMCFMYKHADSVPSIVLRQGMNRVAFEQPWSTIEKIESKPSDRGRSVIRSIDTYWNGPCSTCVSNLCKGAFLCGRFVLDLLRLAGLAITRTYIWQYCAYVICVHWMPWTGVP